MAYKVTWSPEALDDLDSIGEFHCKTDPLFAHTVIEALMILSRKLDTFPLRGRRVPELEGLEYREVFAHSYRLMYRVKENEVKIIAAITCKIPLQPDKFNH